MAKKKSNSIEFNTQTIADSERPIEIVFMGKYRTEIYLEPSEYNTKNHVEPFEIDMSQFHFVEPKIDTEKLTITFAPEPLDYLFNNFKFIHTNKYGTYTFANSYNYKEKSHTILKNYSSDFCRGYLLILVISEKYIRAINLENPFQYYCDQWYGRMYELFKSTYKNSAMPEDYKNDTIKLLEYQTNIDQPLNYSDKDLNLKYEMYYKQKPDLEEIWKMRVYLLNYKMGIERKFEPVYENRNGIKALAFKRLLTSVKDYKAFDANQYFSKLNNGQGNLLKQIDVVTVVTNNMNEIVKESFAYFDESYENEYCAKLQDLFATLTDLQSQILNGGELTEPYKKLLLVNSQDIVTSKIDRIRYLIKFTHKENIEDNLKLIASIQNAIAEYDLMLFQWGYEFEKSLFREMLKKFISEIHERYSTDERRIKAENELPVLEKKGEVFKNTLNPKEDRNKKRKSKSSKEIHITSAAISKIRTDLEGRFNQKEKAIFLSLLKGNPNRGKIQYKGSAISFCRTFNPLLSDNSISTNKIDFINWVIKHFNYTKKDKPQEFSLSTLTKHFHSGSYHL
ncbi:MAG: hypothetical protein IPN14_00380 [Bacteroidetes bacterium]|nr:hypothetical protein [Bacteroidota bacterium]